MNVPRNTTVTVDIVRPGKGTKVVYLSGVK